MERIRKGQKKKKKSVSWKCFVNYVFFFDFVFFCFWKEERKTRGTGGWIGGWLPLSVFVFLSPRV